MIVRTVLGDIDPAQLGPCDAHEHFFLTTPIQPGEDFLDPDKAVDEARTLAAAGARAVVDWTPLGLGRDAAGLQRVAGEAGLHVVASTGAHRDAHYPADHELRSLGAEGLAVRFVADIVEGIDGSGARAGMIKVGASYWQVKPFEATVLEAAAGAHARTGAAIGVHTEHGTLGAELVERLGALGVAASSVILAHVDRNPDAGLHAEVAAAGAWLQLDGPGRTKYWPDSTIVALIGELAERGHADRLLLGGDTGRASTMRAYGGGPGLDYVFARFRPRLERELGAELVEQILVANPARAFAFDPRDAAASPPGAAP